MKHLYAQLIRRSAPAILLIATLFSTHSAFASEITPETVLRFVNEDRAQRGLPALSENESLMRAARAKAEDMAQHEYFAHISPENVTPWYWIEQNGYSYRYAGENLAIRFTDAESQEKAWMESEKHRENILSPKYSDAGVAVREVVSYGNDRAILVVQMFGLPSGATIPERSQLSAQKPPALPEVKAAEAENAPDKTLLSKETANTAAVSLPKHWFPHAATWAGFLLVGLIAWVGAQGMRLNREDILMKLSQKNL